MKISNYLSLNGEILDESQSADILKNRGFLYGDGFFESMHWNVSGSTILHKIASDGESSGKILFSDDHLKRIKNAFRILKFDDSVFDFNQLVEESEQLLKKNNILGDARIRMTFYRISEGNYTPANNKVGYMINASPLSFSGYVMNEEGYNIGFFKEQAKSRTSISNLKTLNSLVCVLAGIYARENKWDDILIFNDAGNVIEFHTSNVFITVDNCLFTPPLSDGCIDGVMRRQVIKLAIQCGITLNEKSLYPADIANADEIILSNAVNGIRWVKQCDNKKYKKVFAEQLFSLLKNHID